MLFSFSKQKPLTRLASRFLSVPLLATSLTVLLAAGTASAQFTIKEERKMLDRADAIFDDADYSAALAQYNTLLRFVPNQPYALLKAGICYLNLSQPEKGLSSLRRAYRLDPNANPQFYYWMGRAFQLNQKVDSALFFYDKFDALSGASRNPLTDQAKLHRQQANAFKAAQQSTDAKAFRMENLGGNINSPYSESNMLITADGTFMVFTSRRPGRGETPMYDGEYTSKIFYSVKQADGRWGAAQEMPTEDSGFPEYTSLQLLANDNLVLLYRHSTTGGKLMVTERSQNQLRLPQAYNIGLDPEYLELDAYFNKENDKVFFTKFPRRTFLDIYRSTKGKDGKWTSPTALSAQVNSPSSDEFAPFLSSNQKEFFFASRKTDGLGGADIYKADFDPATGLVTNARNAGLPYNSAGDEIGYYEIFNKGQRESYIAAERNACFGKTDIFKVVKLEYVTITGKATTTGGKPLANYTLAVTSWDFDECDFIVKTDANGNYKLENVMAGMDYKVAFIRDPKLQDTMAIKELPVPNLTGKNTMTYNFDVTPTKFVVPAREQSPADKSREQSPAMKPKK